MRSPRGISRARRSATRAFCRQGFGALLVKLAAELACSSPPRCGASQWTRNLVDVETASGRSSARAAIVTVSTGVFAAERIKFMPELPKSHREAFAKLSLGH